MDQLSIHLPGDSCQAGTTRLRRLAPNNGSQIGPTTPDSASSRCQNVGRASADRSEGVGVDNGRPFVYAASVCGVIVLRAERIGASFRNPQTAA